MKHILLFVLLSGFVLSAKGQPPMTIRPLTIGDTVPDIEFTNLINYHSTTARLSDFKSKLVILDFWATWCVPCVVALPKMELLQRQYHDKIQIIAITKERYEHVKSFINRNKAAKDIPSIILVANDSLFSRYFKYRAVPHEVWLDGARSVRAITTGQYVTQDNIETLLKGENVDWPLKSESDKIDVTASVMSLTVTGNDNPGKVKYYSMVAPYINGAARGKYIFTDTLNQYIRCNWNNYSILALYSIAFEKYPVFATNPKLCILNVKDSSRFIYNNRATYADSWRTSNWYCYETCSPFLYSEEHIRQRLKSDLDFFFSLNTEISVKKINCLVLKRLNKASDPTASPGGISSTVFFVTKEGSYIYKQKNERLSAIVNTLNNDAWLTEIPLVIDETNYGERIDMELEISQKPLNVEAWRRALNKYGLDLKLEEREIEMLILSDKK